MKICKNKGKTTIVASRQGNMWHLRNGGDGEANASKAGMTKGGKQLPMASRAKPAPETEATCARRLWPPRQGWRRSAARQPCNSRCRQPQPLQPSNVGGPLTSTHRTTASLCDDRHLSRSMLLLWTFFALSRSFIDPCGQKDTRTEG